MEVTLQDKNFRIGKLNALDQLYVYKRLSPILPAFAIGFEKVGELARAGEATDNDNLISMAQMIGAFSSIIETFSRIPDEDMDFILKKCLAVVQIQDGKEWHPVASNGQIMYDSLDVSDMLNLVFYVVRDELVNFIQKTVTNLVAAG